MDTNKVDGTLHEGVDENRRALLAGGFATIIAGTISGTASLAQEALAGQVTPVAEMPAELVYRESELEIDYRAIADAPVDALLSHGEAEWMMNTASAERFQGREGLAERFWTRISSLLGEGIINDSYEDGLREYAPNMLVAFGVHIPRSDPKYGLLAVAGDSFRLDRHLDGQGGDQLASLSNG